MESSLKTTGSERSRPGTLRQAVTCKICGLNAVKARREEEEKEETLNLMQLGCVYLYAFASLLIIQLLKCIRMKLRKRGKDSGFK